MKIEQRMIFEVITDSFFTSGESNNSKRPVNILQGEKIEIRYPYAWHFRTEDNKYFHATKEMISLNCKPFGVILEKIAWENIAELSEILRLKLYTKIKDEPK
jgi:hypothetical protein